MHIARRRLGATALGPTVFDGLEHMGYDELAHGWAEEAWLHAASADRQQPFGPASGGASRPAAGYKRGGASGCRLALAPRQALRKALRTTMQHPRRAPARTSPGR